MNHSCWFWLPSSLSRQSKFCCLNSSLIWLIPLSEFQKWNNILCRCEKHWAFWRQLLYWIFSLSLAELSKGLQLYRYLLLCQRFWHRISSVKLFRKCCLVKSNYAFAQKKCLYLLYKNEIIKSSTPNDTNTMVFAIVSRWEIS